MENVNLLTIGTAQNMVTAQFFLGKGGFMRERSGAKCAGSFRPQPNASGSLTGPVTGA